MSVYLQKVVEYYNWSMEIGGKSMTETALLYAMASDKMAGGGWGGYMEDDQPSW